ncbi:MAG: 50S ribosomal protein L3 [Bdellovibrionales bacterium]|jgi:large subunit ribosomal protein L3|nr:50S ribosomal protein L3 [Bdellovibrionales bacterium]MBT3525992.1 50S ribosomal protein L3 [Bdellovibrionales bacterium]MBT7667998.1 50S ribosomal protein L3 [Bdellovibrionales bacterium]MBT7766767.1 50S ribosomal protein L3 [Bdellovibrionales bacterium]
MGQENRVSLPSFYGVKAGMTRIFDQDGKHIPVTVIKLISNFISQVKTVEKDGYSAYQLAYGEKREKLVTKPVKGHLASAGIEKNLTRFAELKLSDADGENLGKELGYEQFPSDTHVDVSGVTKGKGFQGVMKRHGFSGGPATHGSGFHRTGGSVGQHTSPGRVFKGKKMPGHMGCKNNTIQNLKVAEINEDKGYILIRGSVPGAKNGVVLISKSVKK